MDEREQIELYALGKLSGEPLRDFETRLAADADFAAFVRQEAEMLRALRLSPDVEALREQLKTIEIEQVVSRRVEDLSTFQKLTNHTNPKQGTARFMPRRWLLAAATLVLLVAAVLFLKNRQEVLSPEQVFARHFQPPANLNSPEIRGKTDGQTVQNEFVQQWSEAENLYGAGDYQASLAKWKNLVTLPETLNYQGAINFKAGMTALRANDFPAAISFFEQIPDGSFTTEKPWYLALARLRAGDMAGAKRGFEHIAATDSPFADEARLILKELSTD